jgi:hypothetical protein
MDGDWEGLRSGFGGGCEEKNFCPRREPIFFPPSQKAAALSYLIFSVSEN